MSGADGGASRVAGRYRLSEPLGSGGQGRTFRAVDEQTEQVVAVKLLRLSAAVGWKRFDLFERECAVLRSLDHRGIPRYLDAFTMEERGELGLVMELVEGVTLRQRLERTELLSEALLWNILHQVLEILEYLHTRQPAVIHRDVKPDNLIERPDGRLVLVDFGGVRVALRPEGGSTVVGTFGYMAPEQLHGEAGPAADIFGLGATIAALAAGTAADKLPRSGLKIDLVEVLAPSPLRDLLAGMLEPDPQERLDSVAAVRAAAKGSALTKHEGTSAGRFFRLLGIDDLVEPPRSRAEAAKPPVNEEHLGPFLRRIFAALGHVAFMLVETVILPLVFFLAGKAVASRRRHKLEQRARRARKALQRGRRKMRRIGRGPQDAPRQLPPQPPEPPPPRARRQRRGRRR